MKDKENKELITHIAETLREHEASYKEGAWERFAAIDKGHRRILPIWYLSGAAAILLLSVSVFLYKRADDKVTLSKQMVYKEIPHTTEKKRSVERGSDDNLITKNIEHKNSSVASKTEQLTLNTDHHFIVKKEEQEGPLAEQSILSSSVDKADETEVDKADAAKQQEQLADVKIKKSEKTEEKNNEEALIRMLSQSSQSENVDVKMANNRSIMDRRWDIGVVLAPAVTDQRFNMGGGVTVAYRVSKKISVGSGVSVVDLGLRQAAPQPNGPSASPAMLNSESPLLSAKSTETKELTSVNTNWLALDVPIDIKYHVSKQFYASAGISFFAVLNENRTNNYTTHTPTNRTVNAEGYTFAQQEFEVKNVSEKTDETPFEGNSYSGFLNFSVGRQLPLSKRVGVSVEPFIKLPIGRLSRQDMNLRYGGVRIITSF